MIRSTPSGGTGFLAVFCDLAPEWHRDFRQWLREDMMPARFRIGFRHAASYDLIAGAAGQQGVAEPFVTVYEADSIGDLYGAPYQGLRANRDVRDKAFHARFIQPRRHTLCWVGPELARGDGGFAAIAVFDSFTLGEASVEAFNTWLTTDHLPHLARLPAIQRVRRCLSMEGAPRHVIVTELTDEAALASPAWIASRLAFASAPGLAAERRSGSYRLALGLSRP